MSPSLEIVLLWLAFGTSHIALSSNAWRPAIVARTGSLAFQALYSVLALAIFVPLVSVYLGHRHGGGWLWTVPITPVSLWIVYALTTVGVLLLVAGFVTPSPTSISAGKGPVEVRGVHRITRHPVVMGFGWIGLSHLVLNASLNDVAFWLGFPLFAIVGARHQERRMRVTRGPEFAAYLDATPFVPFTGRGSLRGVAELPPLVWVVGIGLAAGLRWLHGPLFHAPAP
ncbi:MAG TPA: NnrU family protein [Myxococcota bacterium]|nr:NnrU family protein [Myxococcota bacterium]